MKNFFLSLVTIFMLSSFMFANSSHYGENSNEKITKTFKSMVKDEPRVDSFKVVSEESGEDSTGRKYCKITINYYYQGQYVGQQTYTGYTCPIFGESTCREWRENSLGLIQDWVHNNETMFPYHDITC